MTSSVDPWASHTARIHAAQAAYEGALAAWRHSPNSTTAHAAATALAARDHRLEQLWASLTDQQRADVDARPMREMVDA